MKKEVRGKETYKLPNFEPSFTIKVNLNRNLPNKKFLKEVFCYVSTTKRILRPTAESNHIPRSNQTPFLVTPHPMRRFERVCQYMYSFLNICILRNLKSFKACDQLIARGLPEFKKAIFFQQVATLVQITHNLQVTRHSHTSEWK